MVSKTLSCIPGLAAPRRAAGSDGHGPGSPGTTRTRSALSADSWPGLEFSHRLGGVVCCGQDGALREPRGLGAGECGAPHQWSGRWRGPGVYGDLTSGEEQALRETLDQP